MASRHKDRIRQAKRDLEQARNSLKSGYFEWTCFAAQQAAEKAVKAVFQNIGANAWGRSMLELLVELRRTVKVSDTLLDRARELEKFYIPPRYPNAHAAGAPYEFYTKKEAERAIKTAQTIIAFCESHLS
ncbi:MAG: HEPN domain-containing protein [Bacteroidota bacterium]